MPVLEATENSTEAVSLLHPRVSERTAGKDYKTQSRTRTGGRWLGATLVILAILSLRRASCKESCFLASSGSRLALESQRANMKSGSERDKTILAGELTGSSDSRVCLQRQAA